MEAFPDPTAHSAVESRLRKHGGSAVAASSSSRTNVAWDKVAVLNNHLMFPHR